MQPSVDILIFGGAFDPPHIGHTTVVQEVLASNQAEKVVIMPVGQHPFDKHLSPALHRLSMLKLAYASVLAQYPYRVSIDTFELNQEKVSYTYHTIQAYSQQNPEARIGLLIGSDNVESFGSWKFSQALLTECSVYVYPRVGYDFDPSKFPEMQMLSDVSVVKSASSSIRRELADTGTSDLLEPSVLEYILQNNLIQYWNEELDH